MSKAPCLRYFDINTALLLQLDVSEYGVRPCFNQPLTPMPPTTSNGNQSCTVAARFLQLNSGTLKLKKKHVYHCSRLSQIRLAPFRQVLYYGSQWSSTPRNYLQAPSSICSASSPEYDPCSPASIERALPFTLRTPLLECLWPPHLISKSTMS